MDKFDIPEPKKIAPQFTMEQRQSMAPIDLLVQYIMPKLWDKVNYLEWAVKSELHSVRGTLEELHSYVDKIGAGVDSDVSRLGERVAALERSLDGRSQSTEKPRRSSCKKKPAADAMPAPQLDSEPRPAAIEENISEPVAMSRIARYDAQTDQWLPKVVDGVEVTANVVDMVATGVGSYSTEVAAFIYDLSESERKVLCVTFPDETMEELNG